MILCDFHYSWLNRHTELPNTHGPTDIGRNPRFYHHSWVGRRRNRVERFHSVKEIGWDGLGWAEWAGIGCKFARIGWEGVGWVRWAGIDWDGLEWVERAGIGCTLAGMGWDGVGWNGRSGLEGMGWKLAGMSCNRVGWVE